MNHRATHQVQVSIAPATLLRFGLLLVAVLLFWFAGEILLVIFGGILLGVVLRTAADWLHDRTHLGRRLSYTIVVLTIFALLGLIIWWLGPRVVDQAGQIVQVIPRSVAELRDNLATKSWGKQVIAAVSHGFERTNIAGRVATWVSGAADELTLVLIGMVVGFFFALNPDVYSEGVLKIIPEQHRTRARDLFSEIAYTLRWWMIGQLVPMGVLGVGAFIGLMLLGVPLAFTLALFTAVMLFIPYVGSLISLVPAALVGLTKGPETMIWVIIIYLGVHGLEGYLITPLSQKRAIRLPPVITISAQLLMWTVAGLLGLIVATPLAAAVIVTIQMLYCHEKPPHHAAKEA